MPQPRATLVEMHTIVQTFAENEEASLHAYYAQHGAVPAPGRERQVFVLQALVKLLAILATFEEKSRVFVAGLLKEHGRE
jgi:hypothetical protein